MSTRLDMNKCIRDVLAMVGRQQLQLKSWLHIVQVWADAMALGLCLAVLLAVSHLHLFNDKKLN